MNITLMFVHRLSYSVNTSNSGVYINKAADMSNVGGFMNLLSLFSGCGGMDIGFEGDFLCLKKSINTQIHPDWVESENGIRQRYQKRCKSGVGFVFRQKKERCKRSLSR